ILLLWPTKMARTLQLSLPAPRTWGGRRAGAGRKLTPGCRPSVPHRPRPTHTAAHPVHVTLRSGPAVRCLRSDRAFPAVRRALYVASRGNFRIIHFTVQDDQLGDIERPSARRTRHREADEARPEAPRERHCLPEIAPAPAELAPLPLYAAEDDGATGEHERCCRVDHGPMPSWRRIVAASK